MLTNFGRVLVSQVQIRRHNGQCAYGPWIGLEDADDLEHVFGAVADEIAEHDEDEGRIELGGAGWVWRKS